MATKITKKEALKEILNLQKQSGLTGVDPKDIYDLIISLKIDMQYVLDQYELYVTKWKYDFRNTDRKYIGQGNRILNMQNFIDQEYYKDDHNIKDAQTEYLLGDMTLPELKAKCKLIMKKINEERHT